GFLVIVGSPLSSFIGAENLPCVFASAQCFLVGMLCDDICDQPLCRADARNTMSFVRPPAGPKSSKTPFRHPSCILLRSAPPPHEPHFRQSASDTSTCARKPTSRTRGGPQKLTCPSRLTTKSSQGCATVGLRQR